MALYTIISQIDNSSRITILSFYIDYIYTILIIGYYEVFSSKNSPNRQTAGEKVENMTSLIYYTSLLSIFQSTHTVTLGISLVLAMCVS
jgi:hypothetical protein